MGFVEEGRKINEIKLHNNKYIDDVLMYRMVAKKIERKICLHEKI